MCGDKDGPEAWEQSWHVEHMTMISCGSHPSHILYSETSGFSCTQSPAAAFPCILRAVHVMLQAIMLLFCLLEYKQPTDHLVEFCLNLPGIGRFVTRDTLHVPQGKRSGSKNTEAFVVWLQERFSFSFRSLCDMALDSRGLSFRLHL